MGSQKLTGLANGVAAQDAATVGQVFTSGSFTTPTLVSPTITGTITATGVTGALDLTNAASVSVPTATAGDSTTKAASTAFAMTMQSPAFVGTPTSPTAAAGTSTTQLATTEFVANQAFATALPNQAGNSGKFVTTNGSVASWASVPPPTGSIIYLALTQGGF